MMLIMEPRPKRRQVVNEADGLVTEYYGVLTVR